MRARMQVTTSHLSAQHAEHHHGRALCIAAQVVTLDKTGHREPLRGVLYNKTFHVVVSVDEGGTVCVWRMQVRSRAHGH